MLYLCLVDLYFILIFVNTVDAKRCPKPEELSHATISTSNKSFDPGTILIYKCDTGYYLKGPSKKLCYPNGRWIPMVIPTCDNRKRPNIIDLDLKDKYKAGREMKNLEPFRYLNSLNYSFREESNQPDYSSFKELDTVLIASNHNNLNSSHLPVKNLNAKFDNLTDSNHHFNHQQVVSHNVNASDHESNSTFGDTQDRSKSSMLPLLSPLLNMNDTENSQLAHSILIIHRDHQTRPYSTSYKPQIFPAFSTPSYVSFPPPIQPSYPPSKHQNFPPPIQPAFPANHPVSFPPPIKPSYPPSKLSSFPLPLPQIYPQSSQQASTTQKYSTFLHSSQSSSLSNHHTFSSLLSSSTESYPTPIHSNHRPWNNMVPWYKPYVDKMRLSTTTPIPSFLDEVPILVKNNHRKQPGDMLTSQYAHYWTSSSFLATTTPYPTSPLSSFATSSLSSSMYPFSSSTYNVQQNTIKKPLHVSHLSSNADKMPDKIFSRTLTVLDPQDSFSSNLNTTTTVYKNIIIPYKSNRPKPTSTFTLLSGSLPSSHNVNGNASLITSATDHHKFKPNKPAIAIIGDNKPFNRVYPNLAMPSHQQHSTSSLLTGNVFITTTSTTSEPFDYQTEALTTSTSTPVMLAQDSSIQSTYDTSDHNNFSEGFVNAILAPPMPSHPVINYPSSTGNAFLDLMGVDSFSKLFGRFSIFKTFLFTVLVMFAPPLALAAAISQLV